jgi:hypothetical protein
MKKFILLSVVILFPIISPAAIINGPRVDYRGKPSESGQALFRWFSSYCFKPYYKYSYNDWKTFYFLESNKELIEWEIEKFFKENIFRTDFFTRAYVNAEYSVNYLISNPDSAKKMTYIAGLYYEFGRTSGLNNSNSVEGLQYVLAKYNSSWKDKFEGRCNIDYIIKKYDKNNTNRKKVEGKELRKKAYEYYMRLFEKSKYSFPSTEGYKDLLANWDIENTIRDILKQKAVTDKNMSIFVSLFKPLNKIPDNLAENIIQYFKLNTSSPQMKIQLLALMGKNSKLTKAILKNFYYIKKLEQGGEYYSATALALNKNVSITVNPRIRSAKIRTSPSFLFAYAAATGDYNKAFMQFLKEKEQILKEWIVGRKERELNCWQSAFPLLCGNSNLSIRNARAIVNKNAGMPKYWKYKPVKKFGKLIKKKQCENINGIGSYFPFESLTPIAQKTLFETYASRIRKTRMQVDRQAALEKLMQIKSPKYKMKSIKFLMELNSRDGNKALEGISLKWLPELMKVANGKYPMLGVKACQIIGMMSLLGRPAAPGLKKLLNTTKDFTIKIAAICALAEIGDRDSIPLIKTYYKDKNRLLARAAQQAVYILEPINEKDSSVKKMLKKTTNKNKLR